MKKRNLLTAFLALVVCLAVNNVAMSEVVVSKKVAVVDVQAVVSSSAQVKALKKEQENKAKELEKWLKTAKAEVDKQQSQASKDKLLKKYNADLEKKKEDMAKSYQTKLQEIDKSISATIEEQAKANGYGLVFSKSVVLYGADDITPQVQKVVK